MNGEERKVKGAHPSSPFPFPLRPSHEQHKKGDLIEWNRLFVFGYARQALACSDWDGSKLCLLFWGKAITLLKSKKEALHLSLVTLRKNPISRLIRIMNNSNQF